MATTEVLQSPSHLGSPSDEVVENDAAATRRAMRPSADDHDEEDFNDEVKDEEGANQISLLTLLVAVFRKSLVACKSDGDEQLRCSMEIGWPTNVRHVAHVTFDRFNGFLGLPVEFEPEVSRRPPSASTTVFGVSTESMQLSYDSRGNSVPTILLLMQRHLYAQGGLQAEGIFRINGENSQEEYVRDQLNRGIVPEDTDIHCLAGLIKAWFRELPTGILDSLAPAEVMRCQTEEERAQLVRTLPATEAALLDWALNLMADVVQMEHLNKMNAHNIAMVFAPNMTQMVDPLTALMYAVQVMNFLKSLIMRILKEREDFLVEESAFHLEPSDENGHHSPPQLYMKANASDDEEMEKIFTTGEPKFDSSGQLDSKADLLCEKTCRCVHVEEHPNPYDSAEVNMLTHHESLNIHTADWDDNDTDILALVDVEKSKSGQLKNSKFRQGHRKNNRLTTRHGEKGKEITNLSRIDCVPERVEAWR